MRVLLAVAALLAWPAAARAGTVEVRASTIELGGRAGPLVVHTVHFTAAPGERNDVRISGTLPAIRVADAGAPLTAGPGCVADGDAVACRADFGPVFADGGDGDDRIAAAGVVASVRGGAGDDVLSVSGSGGFLYGGAGDDTLIGGDAPDVLAPGPGRNVVAGNGGGDRIDATSAPGRDRIDGGPGEDTLDFSARRAPVRVDLQRTPGLVGIEDVTGSQGDDVIAGDDRANALSGGGGNDRLEGRGGNDSLEDNGRGDDVLLGGAGRDLLLGFGGDDRWDGGPRADEYDLALAGRPGRYDLRCSGPGDRIELTAGDAPAVRLRPGCRRVTISSVALSFHRGRVAARIVPAYRDGSPCDVRLSAPGQTVTLRGLSARRSRRASLALPATVTVRFARRCGGRYATAARLRLG
jgi:hypothetical protein